MKLSVIMPIYNEKNTILKILEKVKEVQLKKEIIVVDDNSTDGTREILKTIEGNWLEREKAEPKNSDIKIIYHNENMGKGAAIRTALRFVTGDIIIIQDGDLEYDPNDYEKLVAPIVKGKEHVVYGSRILGKGKRSYWRYYWGGRLLSFVTNVLYHADITDEPTCYKVFRADILKKMKLKCTGFEFCPEVTAKLCRKGYRIKEVPISYCGRSIEKGKKIRWLDGLIAIYILFKYKFIKLT